MAKMQDLMEVQFPMAGLVTETSFSNQPLGSRDDPRVTTRRARNVGPVNPRNGLSQMSQRAGLDKYVATRVDASANLQVQDLTSIVTSETTPTSTGEIDVRNVTRLAVAKGNIKRYTTAGFTDPAGGTGVGALNTSTISPVVFSQPFFNVVYYVDGAVYKKYTVSSDAVATWAASAGTLPVSGSNRARLICAWGGRIVLSGVAGDGQNYFMSALNDAADFDYSVTLAEDVAVAGNSSLAGQPSDIINALVPYSDDILYFLCDHSIWMMDGNPAAGGRVMLVSGVTGGAWGRPFCRDETGAIYFFGSRGGVFRMEVGAPQSITDNKITKDLRSVNLLTTIVRMEWDDRDQKVHLWLTSLTGAASVHYVWYRQQDAWFDVTYEDAGMNPTAVHTIDADAPTDRYMLLGCRDSYIRYINPDALDDDGETITSDVYMGPIKIGKDRKFMLTEIQAILDDDADFVDFEVYAGTHAQDAFESGVPKISGRFDAGHSYAVRDRCSGRALYIRLKNSALLGHWAMEKLYIRLKEFGLVEQRRP